MQYLWQTWVHLFFITMDEYSNLLSFQSGFFLAVIIAILAIFIAKKNGYFRFPYPSQKISMPIAYPLGAFIIYLVTAFIVLPILLVLTAYFVKGSFKAFSSLSLKEIGLFQFFSFFLLTLFIVIYIVLIKPSIRNAVLWGGGEFKERKTFFKDMGIGAVTWPICYPLMLVVNRLVSALSFYIFGKKGVEQVAVKGLTEMLPYPFLFYLFAFAIVVLIPFVEEVLFRGFLQTWLKQYVGRIAAIFIVAPFFALVHYAPSQGIGNIELIASLFVLSCFLGFIYERQKNLFASFALHVVFNAITVASIKIGFAH